LFFFFFQAEDGIRDFHVTGVQTCALPILRRLIEIGSFPEELGTAVINIDRPEQLADVTGSYFVKDVAARQQLLEAIDVEQRLEQIGRASCREREKGSAGAGAWTYRAVHVG